MSSLLEHTDQLDRELAPEPVKGPAVGSFVLHTVLFATLVLWGMVQGWFHHNLWGASGGSGAIQVNLVSNALPLPSKQPVNQNVLSTETPSQAPTQPEQKAKQVVDEDAIALQGKQKKPEKQTQTRSVVKPTEPVQPNRAQYGEQAGTNVQRTMQNYSVGNTAVSDASFGSLFGWYVQQIDRKMNQSGNRNMADQRTPKGAKASIEFRVYRDGSVGEIKMDTSSGSPTWDNECLRAAQRSYNFGALPPGYRGSYLQVFYDCTY